MPRTIADIEKEIAQLQARRAQLVAKETQEERKARTRQAAILGGWLLANDSEYVERIKTKLTRPQDRKAFGLEPIEPTTSPGGAGGSKPSAAPSGARPTIDQSRVR